MLTTYPAHCQIDIATSSSQSSLSSRFLLFICRGNHTSHHLDYLLILSKSNERKVDDSRYRLTFALVTDGLTLIPPDEATPYDTSDVL